MKTTVSEDRLLIISDVHMGNPLVRAGRRFHDFLRYARANQYSVCINGDGVDLVQMKVRQLTHELAEAFAILKEFPKAGLRIYYTVGNHDIVLEHFLQDWEGMSVVPFLNVQSGDRRIRVEHGHMYDPAFLAWPRMYAVVTALGRWVVLLSPAFYNELTRAKVQTIARLRGWLRPGAPSASIDLTDHKPVFRAAAQEISQRGFDVVVFGHTHHALKAVLPSGALYLNTGFWLREPWCVAIERGETWFGPVESLLAGEKARAVTSDPLLIDR